MSFVFIAAFGSSCEDYAEVVITREHQVKLGRPVVGLHLSVTAFGGFPEAAWRALEDVPGARVGLVGRARAVVVSVAREFDLSFCEGEVAMGLRRRFFAVG